MVRFRLEVCMFVGYFEIFLPFEILCVNVGRFVYIFDISSEVGRRCKVFGVDVRFGRQELFVLGAGRTHYDWDGVFFVRVPPELFRDVLRAIGVFERQIEFVIVQQFAVFVKITRASGKI